MQIFVINLDSAADRLAYMSEQLGSAFERIRAVNGTAVPAHLAGNFGPKNLLPGEIGCYASHMLAAETVLARNLPYAVVLEDDVELADDFMSSVEAAVDHISGNWDIISLSGAKQHPHNPLAQLGRDRSLVRYLHFPKTTAAYAISQSGCRKLLRPRLRCRPIDVDIRYGWEMKIEGFGVYPPPARQSGKFSSSIMKSRRQRFYWRADPLGYCVGRISALRRLGVLNFLRAQLQALRHG
jgi:glycosyl transferase family 25